MGHDVTSICAPDFQIMSELWFISSRASLSLPASISGLPQQTPPFSSMNRYLTPALSMIFFMAAITAGVRWVIHPAKKSTSAFSGSSLTRYEYDCVGLFSMVLLLRISEYFSFSFRVLSLLSPCLRSMSLMGPSSMPTGHTSSHLPHIRQLAVMAAMSRSFLRPLIK